MALYPAISSEDLVAVCEKLSIAFKLPKFQLSHTSQYLASAIAGNDPEITVTEYFGSVSKEQAMQIGAPDHWNLAWRAAVGLRFNYQVAINWEVVSRSRSQQRATARRLRSVFAEVRMHGDPIVPNNVTNNAPSAPEKLPPIK